MPPKPSYGKNLLEIYAGFVRWVVMTKGSLDILCRKWAVAERKAEPVVYPNPVTLPSWIGVASAQEKERRGIQNVSFVGLPGYRQYNAAGWTKARTIFGIDISDYRYSGTTDAGTPNGSVGGGPSRTTTRERMDSQEDNEDLLEEEVRNLRFKDKVFTATSLGNWSTDKTVFQTRMALHQRDRDASLFVQGMEIGEVVWTTDPIVDGVIPSQALVKLRKDTEQTYPDRQWKTLVAERGSDGRNCPPWYYRACRYCLENHLSNGILNTDKLLTQNHPNIVRAFLQRVHDVTWNRRFAEVSGDGEVSWYGLTPSRTQPGDVLCILFGCSVPCILRKRQDQNGDIYFDFIGESYIYGLMDGEAVSGLEQEQLERKSRVFRLL